MTGDVDLIMLLQGAIYFDLLAGSVWRTELRP